jgi:hypothetical protein
MNDEKFRTNHSCPLRFLVRQVQALVAIAFRSEQQTSQSGNKRRDSGREASHSEEAVFSHIRYGVENPPEPCNFPPDIVMNFIPAAQLWLP